MLEPGGQDQGCPDLDTTEGLLPGLQTAAFLLVVLRMSHAQDVRAEERMSPPEAYKDTSHPHPWDLI